MVDYPLEFGTSAEAEKSVKSWEADLSGEEVAVSVPGEFGGDPGAASPEELLTSSIGNCVLATFKTVAERKGLEFESIESTTESVLERGEDSRPLLSSAEVEITVRGVEDAEAAEEVREATLKNCFVHRSLQTDVQTEFRFEEQ